MSFGKIGSDLAIAAPRTAFPGVIAFAADKLVSSIPAAARIFTYIPKGGTPFCLAVNTFRKVCSYALNLKRPVSDANTTERAVRNATFLILGGMIFTHISPFIKVGAFKLGEISGKDAVKWVLLIAAVEAGIDYLSRSDTSSSHRKHKHRHHHREHADGSRRSSSAERKHRGSEDGRKSVKRYSHSHQQQTSSSASVADDNVDRNVPAAPGLGTNTLGRANQPTSSSAFKINRRQESSLVKHKAEERARNIAAGRVDASQSVKKDFEGKGALGYRSGSDDDEGSGSDYSQGSQRSSSGNESEGEPTPKAVNKAASHQSQPASHSVSTSSSSAETDEHEEGVGVGSGEMATNPEAEGSAAPEDSSSTEAPPAPPAEDSSTEGGAPPPPPPPPGAATLGRLNAIVVNTGSNLVIKKKKKTAEGSEASGSASAPKGSSIDSGNVALQAKQKADARAAKLASGEQKPIEVKKREIPKLEAPKIQLKSRAAGKKK